MSASPKLVVPSASALVEQQRDLEKLSSDGIGFHRLAVLLKELTGIYLNDSPKNRSLLVSRIASILRARGIGSLNEYYNFLRGTPPDSPEIGQFVSSMTTNTTRFFRESAHFRQLQAILPKIIEQKDKMHGADASEIRIWCAASSTGQEPYTLAMVVQDELVRISPKKQWHLKLLASDIDRPSLRKAASGIYLQQEIEGVPPEYLKKYFVPRVDPQVGKKYMIHPGLAKKVTFTEINLTSQPYPMQRLFDVVFCRNVLIYFDRETAEQVVSNLGKVLRPGGYLFLGHSESGSMRHSEFETISHAAYRKKGGSR
jgi:chemotaxis protein methyltransferase CheR